MDKKEIERLNKAKGNALGSLYDLNEHTAGLKLTADERVRIQHMISEIGRIIHYRWNEQVGGRVDSHNCGCSGCGCQ